MVAATSPQDSTTVAFLATTTSNYQATTSGSLQVSFNSIQLTTMYPQAYAFGIAAKTVSGLYITELIWQFGDGSVLDVPYCCQSQISEVRYHIYAQPQTYTVTVTAYDNAGNYGSAIVAVNWPVPAPEFPTANLSMVASFLIVLVSAAFLKARQSRLSFMQ